MDGRREQLDGGRRDELRDRLAADPPAHLGAQALRDRGAEQRRDVERGEDGQTVAQREEGVRGQRDGTRRSAGPEKFRVHLVLIDAEPDVAVEEAANLAVPEDTYVAGWPRAVDEAVSSVLAVRYVPP